MRARRSRPVSDRHDIKAMVYRRGGTLRSIAVAAGLSESVCRAALLRPSPAGEAAIAEFLDMTVHELWPERYPTLPASRRENATNGRRETSLIDTTNQTSASSRSRASIP